MNAEADTQPPGKADLNSLAAVVETGDKITFNNREKEYAVETINHSDSGIQVNVMGVSDSEKLALQNHSNPSVAPQGLSQRETENLDSVRIAEATRLETGTVYKQTEDVRDPEYVVIQGTTTEDGFTKVQYIMFRYDGYFQKSSYEYNHSAMPVKEGLTSDEYEQIGRIRIGEESGGYVDTKMNEEVYIESLSWEGLKKATFDDADISDRELIRWSQYVERFDDRYEKRDA